MSDKDRYGVLKDKLNNDFVLGDDRAPKTVVDAKRVLADFLVTTTPKRSVKTEETEGTGLTFVEAAAERKKKIQCFGCGGRGHYLSNCTKTSTAKKAEILAMVKTGDFKTAKGVVQLNAGKGGGEAAKPPEDNDVEDYIDFVGEQHMNFGECDSGDDPFDDESDLESSFTFLGINFGEWGEESPPAEDPQENSTQIGRSCGREEKENPVFWMWRERTLPERLYED